MKKIDLNTLTAFEVESLAFDKAVKYLSFKARTEKEMRTYLYERDFWKPVVEKTIQKLKSYHYIDDEKYTLDFIEARKNLKGYKLLAYELKHKGVAENIINNALQQFDSQEETIEKLATKFIKSKEKNEKLREKTFRFLAGKGFEFDEINFALRRLLDDNRD